MFPTAATRGFDWRLVASVLAQRLSFLVGYWLCAGALAAGIIADLFDAAWAIASIGALTFASGVVLGIVIQEDPQ